MFPSFSTNAPPELSQVMEVMQRIPRRRFVPPFLRPRAKEDIPLPIGYGQTISQPRLVAEMTYLVRPLPADLALEIGAGSGFQAALLAKFVREVHTVEIIKPLAKSARSRLVSLGYQNVHVHHADGSYGWPPNAPYDIIVVSAAPLDIPTSLVDQLATGGRMILPVGNSRHQEMKLIRKAADGHIDVRKVGNVAFVPFVQESKT